MSSERARTRTIDVAPLLALLTLPDLDSLSEQQVRGAACVWDGIVLTAETAVDLGTRTAARAGQDVPWFPRACRGCVHTAARLQFVTHIPCCEQCADEVSECELGFGLLRLTKVYRP